MPVKLEVWGEYALFTRPEMKTERVSYDVMTPSAARGILEAIYWHEGMRWVIDRITVCAPIRFTSIRRNEVEAKISHSNVEKAMKKGNYELYISTSSAIVQRAATVLKNVRYVIDAHFEMTDRAAPGDNSGKFQDITMRRIEKGQCFHTPYFGCREFPVNFRLCDKTPECPQELLGTRELGYMLWDMDYSDAENIQPLFFRAALRDGVLTVPDRNSGEVIG